jgi:opacity protein-like surface antigen
LFKYIVSTACLVASLAQANTQVEDRLESSPGWYVGASIGKIDASLEGTRNFDSSGLIYGVYGGYDFLPWLGVEIEYQKSEDLDEDLVLSEFPPLGSSVDSIQYTTYSLMPKFNWNLTKNFNLSGKLGIAVLNYSEHLALRSLIGLPSSKNQSWNDTSFGYALGAELSITQHLLLRLSTSGMKGSFNNIDDQGNDIDVKVETLTLGMQYQF